VNHWDNARGEWEGNGINLVWRGEGAVLSAAIYNVLIESFLTSF
jgi:hypothetical protein